MKFNMLGDANMPGPVRLSDVYDSAVGDASTGIAASQKALYEAYNSLNSSIAAVNNKLNPVYVTRSVRITGDGGTSTGLIYRSADCPSVSKYTPVGVLGWTCAGAAEFGIYMFDVYVSGTKVSVNYKGSISSSNSISVIVLYLRTS